MKSGVMVPCLPDNLIITENKTYDYNEEDEINNSQFFLTISSRNKYVFILLQIPGNWSIAILKGRHQVFRSSNQRQRAKCGIMRQHKLFFKFLHGKPQIRMCAMACMGVTIQMCEYIFFYSITYFCHCAAPMREHRLQGLSVQEIDHQASVIYVSVCVYKHAHTYR